MKTLYLLFFILCCSTSLSAENVSVLTEIEQIQEKLWYLQRDMKAQNASIEEQQKRLGGWASSAARERSEMNEQLAALARGTAVQQEKLSQMQNALLEFGEALSALTAETAQHNSALLVEAGRLSALERSLSILQDGFAAQQSDTGPALADLRAQLAEARSKIDALGQDMSGRVEQVGYLGAGAFLILSLVLIVGYLARKSKEGKPRFR